MTYDPNRPLNPTATERDIDRTADTTHNAVDQAADKSSNLVDKASDKANQVVSAVTDKVNDLKNQAGQGDLKNQATQVASDVKDRATAVAGQAAERADAATTTVGTKMQDAAQMLREKAPAEGTLGTAADATAHTLERAGSYLQQQDLTGMRSDLESIIRRHPTESLLVAFGVGFLLARSSRR
jgi:gas vesicle protein